MTPDIAVARELLAAQPFSRLLGARLSRFEAGVAELTIPLGDHLRQQHGGALSYAADTALTFAAGSIAGDAVLTSEMKINYIRGARGDELITRAEVVHAGSTLVTVRCEVFDRGGYGDGERLCAVALGTVARR
ncbi:MULTISPECIES: PaaI family thioesterase [unclassified Frankia]